MRHTRQAVLLALCCLVPLGCSSDGPDGPTAADFREGACRTLAPAVLTIGTEARRLGDGPTPPTEVVQRLTDAQTALRDPAVGATGDVVAPLTQLVTDVGFARVRSFSNTYEPEVGAKVLASYDAVVAVCTAPQTPS